MHTQAIVIFDFQKNADISNWQVVDDVVMGGRSAGNFKLNDEGHGVFFGKVSLENNGGFSSVRYLFNRKNIEGYRFVKIRLKGDGNTYQFRIKTNQNDYYSYNASFDTSGEWEVIELPLALMYPSYRGRKLAMGNFPALKMSEIRFLIGNNKPQSFELLIDKLRLE